MDDLLHLARLALKFGKVDRVTFHPDGVTRESDTDHTVMLALVAPALAARLRPDLSPDRVAAFAVVHDLVEVKVGDTNTIGITSEGRAEKAAREAAALVELREELRAFPWLVDTLDRYEAQVEPEARWTRFIDKVLPKLTHTLNRGATLRLMGKSAEEIRTDGARQREVLRAEYPEFPEADLLLWQAVEVAEAACIAAPIDDEPVEVGGCHPERMDPGDGLGCGMSCTYPDCEAGRADAAPPRTCNRHLDCDDADNRSGGRAQHCHDDTCEDCFGQ